jgi:DNA-binding NtrC family response regulator
MPDGALAVKDPGTGSATSRGSRRRAGPSYPRREAMPRRPPTARRNPKPGTGGPRSTGRLQRAIDTVVKHEIEAALSETDGNVVRAARVLGISQPGLYKRLIALGIEPDHFRK